jgi:hypothetical protein
MLSLVPFFPPWVRHRVTKDGLQFYVQTYAVGLTGLNDKIYKYIDGINDIIQQSLPGHKMGAYAGYVE